MREQLADLGDDLVRIGVVDLRESGPQGGREFEAEKTPAALEHAVRFAQRLGDVGDVPDPERDRIGVEEAVGELERFGIGLGPHQPVDPALLRAIRSEEHTSELQSLMRSSYAVFCLKKKTH